MSELNNQKKNCFNLNNANKMLIIEIKNQFSKKKYPKRLSGKKRLHSTWHCKLLLVKLNKKPLYK